MNSNYRYISKQAVTNAHSFLSFRQPSCECTSEWKYKTTLTRYIVQFVGDRFLFISEQNRTQTRVQIDTVG